MSIIEKAPDIMQVPSRHISPPLWHVLLASLLAIGAAIISTGSIPILINTSSLFALSMTYSTNGFFSLLLFSSPILSILASAIMPFFIFFVVFGKYELRSAALLAFSFAIALGTVLMILSPNPYLMYVAYVPAILVPLTSTGKLKFKWSFLAFVLTCVITLTPRDTTQEAIMNFFSKIINYWI